MQGIPTVTLVRTDFAGVMKHAVSGLGLPPDAAIVTFPMDVFLAGSDLTPLQANKRGIYDGLTRWQSEYAQDAADAAAMLRVEGANYEDALRKANHLLLMNRCGDGLPMWPPTGGATNWLLRGSALPRAHVISRCPARGGATTVETCAVALAMAGGRPEYLSVLVAAVEAFLDAESYSDQ